MNNSTKVCMIFLFQALAFGMSFASNNAQEITSVKALLLRSEEELRRAIDFCSETGDFLPTRKTIPLDNESKAWEMINQHEDRSLSIAHSLLPLSYDRIMFTSCNRLDWLVGRCSLLANVTSLYLRGHNIETFPSDFSCFTQLKKLDLSGNSLTKLPEEITGLSHLTHLILAVNMLTEVPKKCTYLNELQELNLRGNKIRNFPESLIHLKALNLLDLSSQRGQIEVPQKCDVPATFEWLLVSSGGYDENWSKFRGYLGTPIESQDIKMGLIRGEICTVETKINTRVTVKILGY